jgi:hypothetical protein
MEGKMADNDQTLDEFFAVFASHKSAAEKVAALMHLFCADHPRAKTPAVGITDHGHNFIGVAEVRLLFHSLFASFPDLEWAPVQLSFPGLAAGVKAPRLYSRDDYPSQAKPVHVIGIQTNLSGTHTHPWFPDPKDKHHSSPLSDIEPAKKELGEKLLQTSTPTDAVFAFDSDHKITHLWMYLDRYRFVHHLHPGAATFLSAFNHARTVRHKAMHDSKKHK